MTAAESGDITRELALGKFTDEMLNDMRARIGLELRTDACVNNEDATRLAILRFCEGIGDDNPLWTDPDYAGTTPHGTLIAPPSFIFACLASVQFGWRGLGGFHAETKLTFHRTIKIGDKVTARVFFDGFDGPIESNFGGRRIKDYIRQEYYNQEGALIATFICSRVRFERTEMQKRRESRKLELPHPWKNAEIDQIENDILAETPRGALARFWEDVNVGDEIDVVTKGPISLSDEIAYIAAGAAPIPRIAAHRIALRGLSPPPPLGLPGPHNTWARAGLFRPLQRLRRTATGRAGRLRCRHSKNVLADPFADQLDGRRGLPQDCRFAVPSPRLPF
jgi:acyl dehydratase